ncbi:MAG: (2Fe-2S)-binding protein [Bacillota bacterium]
MILESAKVICRCEEVTDSKIKEAISAGADTPDAIKRVTRAGMGLCQGRTCGRLVMSMLAKEANISLEKIPMISHRPPVRPIKLETLAVEEIDNDAQEVI